MLVIIILFCDDRAKQLRELDQVLDPLPLSELPPNRRKERIKYVRNDAHTGPSASWAKYKMYEDIKESRSFAEVVKRFAIGYTSAHGLPNIYKSTNIIARIIWSLLFIGGIIGVFIQVYLLQERYFQYGTSTEVGLMV